MARSPLRRYAYVALQVAVIVLLVPLAIRYAERLRSGRGSSPAPFDPVGYYQNILKDDPGNVMATRALADLYFDRKNFDESRRYYDKAMEMDPYDPESYYSIAVIDWTKAYQLRSETGTTLDLDARNRSKDQKACRDLRSKNSARISEGMDMLLHVLGLRPGYKNATFYMGMLWHEKAYIECGNRAAMRSDLKKAEQWMDKPRSTPSYDDSKSAKLYVASIHQRNSDHRKTGLVYFLN